MGLMNKKIEEEADFAYDVRLWKRRYIAHENLKLNYCNNKAQKTLNDNGNGNCINAEEVMVDADYAMFMNSIEEFVDGSHVDARCVEKDNDECDGDGGDSDDDADPQYKMFLDKLREDGKSYVLEIDACDGVSMLIKYEMEDGPCTGHGLKEARTVKNRLETENIKTQRVLNRTAPKGLRTENPRESNDVLRKENIESHRILSVLRKERKSPVVEKNVEVEAEDPVSCRISLRSSKRPSPEDVHSAKRKCNREMNCDMVDESYQEFLNSLKNDGEVIVFTPESGLQVKDEMNEGSLSDSEIIVLDNPFPDGINNTPFVPSKLICSYVISDEDCLVCNGSPARSNPSPFREKLMDLLKKPFDEKEYDDLLNRVYERKPVERERNLRGGPKSYVSDSIGKSYLEQYNDLAEKIQSYEMDNPKRLNILRGFFYWLMNVSHEGAFKPWLDSSV